MSKFIEATTYRDGDVILLNLDHTVRFVKGQYGAVAIQQEASQTVRIELRESIVVIDKRVQEAESTN